MNNFLQSIKNLSPGRLVSISAIIIFLISFFAYIATQVSATEYAVLYTDLELEDAKQIVTRLEAANVKYKLTKNGTEVQVPKDLVNKMRVDTAELAMASKGVNLIRALEGELARTIRSVDNIKSARVHLVLPKREMFSREEQAPSASVVIKTVHGSLDLKNIQSIQKLVAAAVPKLDVKNVAIVDSAGNLLTNNYDDEETLQHANIEMMRMEQERKLALSVQNLLEKTVGPGKVRAQVNIEMDMDKVVTNEEVYDPDSQVVRSQSSVTEEGLSREGEAPVTVAQNIPNGDNVVDNANNLSQNSRVEETINYEISKVVRNKVRNAGVVKRLSVAVMVDGVYEKDADGKTVYRDRTAEEMEQLSALVKSAVGYDANRGDIVEVENMKFVEITPETFNEEEILIMGFTKEELMRIAEGLGVAIVAVLVILLVIRPLINNAFDTNNATQRLLGENEEENLLLSNFLNNDDSELDELVTMNKVDGRIKAASIKRINELVDKNPDAAVNVVRGWLYQNEN